MKSHNREGFTLIELLIVIAIILILIAIALPNFLEAQIRARVTKSYAELRTYQTALESYYLDWGMFPRDHDSAWPYFQPEQNGFTQLTTPLQYLKTLPQDPFGTNVASNSNDISGVPRDRAFFYEGSSGSDNDACGGHITPYQTGSPSPPNRVMAKLCIQAYLAQGIGPDQKENTDGNDSFPYRQSGIIGMTSYSATNGTRSRGDLYKMSGDWRHGWINLDGILIGGRIRLR